MIPLTDRTIAPKLSDTVGRDGTETNEIDFVSRRKGTDEALET